MVFLATISVRPLITIVVLTSGYLPQTVCASPISCLINPAPLTAQVTNANFMTANLRDLQRLYSVNGHVLPKQPVSPSTLSGLSLTPLVHPPHTPALPLQSQTLSVPQAVLSFSPYNTISTSPDPVDIISAQPQPTMPALLKTSPPRTSLRRPSRFSLTTCAIYDKSAFSAATTSAASSVVPHRTKGVTPGTQSSVSLPSVIPQHQYGSLVKGPDFDLWQAELTKVAHLETTKVMRFCSTTDKPVAEKAKYSRIVSKMKIDPNAATHRVRVTVADTNSDYPGPTAAYTATYKTSNLLFNAIVSEIAAG